MQDTYHILYTSDRNYFPHMLTSIYSLLENNSSSNFMIHIIGSKFTKEEDKRLADIICLYPNSDIQVYDMNKIAQLMNKFNMPKWNGTDIANARVFFHNVIPNVSKLLYLDCDTTIVNNLDSLFQKEIETPVAAVKEIVLPTHIKGRLNTYYNSGVMLFCYDLWEKEDCFQLLYNTLQNLDQKLLYPDQDLLNFSLQERITPLNLTYNIMPIVATTMNSPSLAKKIYHDRLYFYEYNEVKDAFDKPHILHNLSYLQTRVWQQNKVHPFNSYYDYYRMMWDHHYQKEKNTKFLSNCSLTPTLNLAAKTYASDEVYQKIKKIVKKIGNNK